MGLPGNEFGKLVKAYRKQRGWTQEQLAEKWGHARSYITQVELGLAKLDSTAQVVRLADILDIPEEKLEAIGRGIPIRRGKREPTKETNDTLLQMLLAPGRDMVRLAYLTWQADQHPVFEESLRNLSYNLDQALTAYQGEFRLPAQQLLAYAHQMQGKIALDRLDLTAASAHFSEMIELGQALNDADIITVGMIHQANILKKRGRYEHALRCFDAAKPYADVASRHVQGTYFMLMARSFYDSGNEQSFLRTINNALDIVADLKDSITSLANEFSLDDVLCEQAGGFTELGQPEKAIEIYEYADKLRPKRLLREQGSYIITKAQAYLQALELEPGVELALQGIELASEYQSRRHIGWLEKSYNRLIITPGGNRKDRKILLLRDALRDAGRQSQTW